jgi:CSLREA domain-containing protein
MARSFLSWLKGSKTSRRQARNRQTTRRFVPGMEALEAREVPATFTVNTLVDESNGIGVDGVSLREAIAAANANTEADTINCSVTGTINLGGILPSLSGDLSIINGNSGPLVVRRDTGGNYRIFTVTTGATVGISGLTIANGVASDGYALVNGGGINNAGTLTVTDCFITGNGGTYGGGISNAGTLTVSNSTFASNEALNGGGISNAGTLTVSNSTFASNSASAGGGGISNYGTLRVSNSTFASNFARNGGGGISNEYSATLTLNNTIVAFNSGTIEIGNGGSITGSHNLIGDGSGGLSDTITDDPKLAPLGYYGGPTKTMALLAGSPAIDAGSNAAATAAGLTTDQRGPGFARIVGGAVDIGAFEVQNSAPTITRPGTQIAYEDVDLAFSESNGNSISVKDAEGDILTVTLAVSHGTLTLGTTTGRTVSLTGSIVDLNAALAGLVYRSDLNYSGDDSLDITVSDGSLSTTDSVAISVRSAAQQAAELEVLVNGLSGLTDGQKEALILNLRDNNGDAGKVQAFLNQVSAFLTAGNLPPEEAAQFSYWGNILLLSVTRR